MNIPPTIPTISAKIVSSGSITTIASSRGTTSIRTGESPNAWRASICSVTTIEPSSAEMAGHRERDRAADEVADAGLHGLNGGFEREHHPGKERRQQDDRPGLDAE